MHYIPLEFLSLEGNGFHILVEVQLFDKTFKMVVDTGASKTVLDRTMILQSGIEEALFEPTDILSTGLGTNSMESFLLDVPTLKIQNWSTKHLKVAILDLSSINHAYEYMNFSPVIGVFGGDLLVRYGAVIDYRKRTMRLNTKAISDLKQPSMNV